MSAQRHHLARTHRTRTHLTIARRAGLLTIGTATALGLTAGLAGSASALSPLPQPDLPIVMAPWNPEPPVVIDDLIAPPELPDPEGPGELTTPPTIPDPFPVPPELPGDFTIGEDDGPGAPGPDDLSGGGDDGPGIPEGPDDLTIGDPDPTDHPTPTVPETTVPETTVPEAAEPEPEVLDATEAAAPVAADSLAFTGNDVGLAAAGAGLLAAGGIAAGVAALARRRREDEAGELA